MRAMVTDSATDNLFYGPIHRMPDSFPSTEKKRLTELYSRLIVEQLVPAYKKLADFLQYEYLPKSRNSSGIDGIPGGAADYHYLMRFWTTTDKPQGEIYNTGLAEVKRIRTEIENTMIETGFRGNLSSFFTFIKTNKKFTPYNTAGEILDGFRSIKEKLIRN